MSANTKNPYLDATGLSQVWAAIIANFVQQEAGKGLSANDLTDALLEKLNGIAAGAQVNVIESVKVNGVALDITEKGVNVLVPTGALASLDKVSESDLDTALAALINSHATKSYVDDELAKKADAATTIAGYGITDAYTKGEVNDELDKKADKATTVAGYGITDAYTKTEVYTRGEADTAIKNAVDIAVAGVYKVKGSIAFAEATLEGQVEGNVYNITDAFTTTADFVEGAGVKYPAGTNIVAVTVGESLKWDVMAGTYDFSDFLMKDDIRSLTEDEIADICKIN